LDNKYLDLLGQQEPASPAAGNPYIDALDAQERGQTTALRASATLNATGNPDEIARQKRVADLLGSPLAAVQALPQDADRAVKLRELEQNTANAPVLRQKYTDADFMALAHDNSGNLSGIERLLSTAGSTLRAIPAGLQKMAGNTVYGGGQLASALMSEYVTGPLHDMGVGARDPFAAIADKFAGWRKSALAAGDWIAGDNQDNWVAQSVVSGGESLGRMLPGLAASVITKNPQYALLSGALDQGLSSSSAALDAGKPAAQALAYGAEDAAAEYATELLPMHYLIKDLKAGAPFWKLLGHQVATELPTELVATPWQGFNEWANMHPEQSFGDFLQTLPGSEAQTAISTLTTTLLTAGFGKAIHVAATRGQKAQDADQGAALIDNLNQLAGADKLLKRDPATFEQFIADAANDGPVQQVFIDAKSLMQSGLGGELAKVSPAVASQLDTALATGGQVAIPIEEYAARVAPTELAPQLLDHLKTEPDGFSRAEAQQYMQSEAAQELQAHIERAMTEKQDDDSFKASAEAVKANIKGQLDTAARFTPQVNDLYAALHGNFYAVQAARLGITPEEYYQRYPLKVGAESVAGQQFDQSQNGSVTLRAFANKGHDKAIVAQALVDRAGADAKNLTDVLVGEAGRSESDRLGSVPTLAPVLAHMRRAVLDDPKILDAVVGSVPIDVVNNLFGSKDAAKVALHDEAMLKNSPAFNADLPVSGALGDASNPVGLLVRQAAFEAAKIARVAFGAGGSLEGSSTAVGANDGHSFSQGITPRATYSPSQNLITLLRGADLSSFLHESGHAFLEMQFDMASRLQQEAQAFGVDGMKPGERELLADTDALLRWFGVRDLAEWHNLDFEEKRVYHEQFARGFEAYLFDGNAPSIELHGMFQRFRAWLLNVYKTLKELNVELTDEVRGVMDRMLASTEEIQLAEQARSMMPLFASPEQAGMTPEEFAAYQALGVDATNEAAQDLQARGLRDMQWLHNARGRMVKKLQKESAARRAEVQMDVRREVMSQPLYRAWDFLTRKLGAEDRLPGKAKGDPDVLDPTRDSLFAAIAKLGGIQKDKAVAEWGVDAKGKPQSGVFGKPVWRLDGGMPLDLMAEALARHGYLEADEHGKLDLQQFYARFTEELGGNPQYSNAYDYGAEDAPPVANPDALTAGRLDLGALEGMGLPAEVVNALKARRMTAKEGLAPDLVAEMFGFTSGDELARKLAAAETPKDTINALTDVRMLEEHGELATPEAIERAADKAIHNDVRARMVATEVNAMAKATGQRKVLASAAKEFARAMIARLKVRNISPGQYANAEVRAAKAAEKASRAGKLAEAASEKRNQIINLYATRAAYDAQDEVDSGLRYFRKFDSAAVRKGLDADYTDQIDALLERFDVRKISNKAVDRRAALADWIQSQRDKGLEPDIPTELVDAAFRKSYKDMTLEEFRGLVDTVKQIEHLGRLKNKLLTAAGQRDYEAARDEIVASIEAHAQGRQADTRTPTTNMGRALQGLKRFWASHIKAATWARVMDGGKDGGPMWEYFIRSANERGDMETAMRAEATAKLSAVLDPVFKLGRMGGAGQFFPSINRSLNREARLAIALNTGNAGNLQRLLGGEGWNMQQLMPVLQSLTAQEWHAVQAVWDHFESYRPQIAAKERRIYGKEPDWVAPQAFSVKTADGESVELRGGYYPIKYDPAASQRAEEHADAESAKRQLQGAYTTSTTRRSFTKARAEEVSGRPLLYTLAGMYSGVNDVIHDLSWHEWLIDANRLLRSHSIDDAIRQHYGPAAKQQFKSWAADIAEGEKGHDAAVDIALSRLRQGVSASGLGFNVMSALIQPLGITQSITRVGAPWIGRGVMKYLAHPVDLTRQVNELSSFMENRARTRFREINELRNKVQSANKLVGKADEFVGNYAYFLMMRCQQMVDVPTWWGAYEKAIGEGNEDERAIALADQAVIDSQGGGMTKDLSAIERGGPAQRLFTVFYSFMNTALNIGVDKTMSADTPAKRAKLAVDYAMLYVVPAVLGYFLKAMLTPGGSGDDDPEKIAKRLLANEIDYLMGLMVVVREFGEAAKTVTGANDLGRDYTGPAGLRLVADVGKLANQAHQGEFDDAFRKASVNVIGDLLGLPSAQVNRTITGAQALAEGKTENPAALAFGFQERH